MQVIKALERVRKQNETSAIKNTVRYDIDRIADLFAKEVVKLVPNFQLDDHNKAIIEALILYFARDPEFEKTQLCKSPSLDKSILLMGGVGVGKTVIMTAYGYAMQLTPFSFGVVSCRDIIKDFAVKGYDGIKRYSETFGVTVNNTADRSKPVDLCLDDLGTEPDAFHFGNKINVIEGIIQDRYIYFTRFGMRTHMTTNLNGIEIRDEYGERVASRIRQMCNQFKITGNDRRA